MSHYNAGLNQRVLTTSANGKNAPKKKNQNIQVVVRCRLVSITYALIFSSYILLSRVHSDVIWYEISLDNMHTFIYLSSWISVMFSQ